VYNEPWRFCNKSARSWHNLPPSSGSHKARQLYELKDIFPLAFYERLEIFFAPSVWYGLHKIAYDLKKTRHEKSLEGSLFSKRKSFPLEHFYLLIASYHVFCGNQDLELLLILEELFKVINDRSRVRFQTYSSNNLYIPFYHTGNFQRGIFLTAL